MATELTVRTAEWVVRAQRGDSAAFADLYEAYAPLVSRSLRRRLIGSDELVEDLTEDVFVKLYEKLDRYIDCGAPFTAWLYRVAHNYLVDYLRRASLHPEHSLDVVADVAERSAGTEYSQVLDRQTIDVALARLTPEQRQVIELRFLVGMSVAETAMRVGRPEGAVKKLQARGLLKMRQELTTSTPAQPAVQARAAAA